MAKFCPRCGLIILDRTLPACPKCGAGLPWAVTNQPAAPPEPAEPALPADPALPAEPGRPAGSPAQPPGPLRAPVHPLQELPYGPAESMEPPVPVPPPPYIPPVRPGTSQTRHPKKPVAEGGGTAAKWIGICCGGIFLLIFISVFFAVISDDSSSDPDSFEYVTVSPDYDGDSAETPTEIAVAIGQTASDGSAQATVYSAGKKPAYSWSASSSDSLYTEEAESGTNFLIIDAEVKNTGAGTMYASTSDFYLTDGEGNRYEPGLYYGDESFSYLKELSPGQKNRGKIQFGIPENARDLKIFYDFGTSYHPAWVASWTLE